MKRTSAQSSESHFKTAGRKERKKVFLEWEGRDSFILLILKTLEAWISSWDTKARQWSTQTRMQASASVPFTEMLPWSSSIAYFFCSKMERCLNLLWLKSALQECVSETKKKKKTRLQTVQCFSYRDQKGLHSLCHSEGQTAVFSLPP